MTYEELDDGIERKPAEGSPWYQFMKKTIQLDKDNKNFIGYHWFWGIYLLHKEIPEFPKVNLKAIQKTIPEGHWLKEMSETALPATSGYLNGLDQIHDVLLKKGAFALFQNFLEIPENPRIKKIDFSGLFFQKVLHFSNFVFPVRVSFKQAVFSGDVNFGTASFQENTNFTSVHFFNKAFFRETLFSRGVAFNNTKFYGRAFFEQTSFASPVIFSNTKFYGRAFFEQTIFSNRAIFLNTKFFDLTTFEKASFSGVVIFKEAEFFKEIKFNKVEILGHTNFTNAKFKKFSPSFYNATLYSDIFWDNIEWPDIEKTIGKNKLRRIQNAYETLSYHMKILDKYHEEHFFFRQEMRCRRKLEKNRLIRFSYLVYEKFSNYGYSIVRAFSWWLAHIASGVFFLMIIIRINIDLGHKDLELAKGFWCSISTSFSNAHRFLSFHNGALDYCHDYLKGLYLFDIIWAFQSIIGILFLFLLLLTLRIRFRLK